MSLDAKLDAFDRNAQDSVLHLIQWLQEHPNDLIAVARGRHVIGHYLFEDRNFHEYDGPRLTAEIAEELADAIVYMSRLLHLERDDTFD